MVSDKAIEGIKSGDLFKASMDKHLMDCVYCSMIYHKFVCFSGTTLWMKFIFILRQFQTSNNVIFSIL